MVFAGAAAGVAGFVGARAALARRELGHDLAVAGQPHQRHRPHSRRAQLGVVAQDDLDQVGVEAGDGRPDQVQGEGGHLDVLAVVAVGSSATRVSPRRMWPRAEVRPGRVMPLTPDASTGHSP
ncbi:hypothetical protein DMB42_46015 [Nonomuraea sp. WAC 01424]|nr:hypothetical protein DMB42_46015 [Nonomuraea sp. WAC 01424]